MPLQEQVLGKNDLLCWLVVLNYYCLMTILTICSLFWFKCLQTDYVCQKVIKRFLLHYCGKISFLIELLNLMLILFLSSYIGEGNEWIEGRIQHCWPLPGKTWELGFKLFFLLFFFNWCKLFLFLFLWGVSMDVNHCYIRKLTFAKVLNHC